MGQDVPRMLPCVIAASSDPCSEELETDRGCESDLDTNAPLLGRTARRPVLMPAHALAGHCLSTPDQREPITEAVRKRPGVSATNGRCRWVGNGTQPSRPRGHRLVCRHGVTLEGNGSSDGFGGTLIDPYLLGLLPLRDCNAGGRPDRFLHAPRGPILN